MEPKHLGQEWHDKLKAEIARVADRYSQFVMLSKQAYEVSRGIDAPESSDESSEQSRKLASGLRSIFDRLDRGFQNMLEHLEDLQQTDPGALDLSVISHIAEMMVIATTIGLQKNTIVEQVAEGACLQDVLEIPDSGVDSLYKGAKYFYEQQLYEEASIVFTILSLLQPAQPIFWLGLGNSEYFLSRYKQALMAYTLASHVDNHEPQYHILAARCHQVMGNRGGALSSLHLAELSAIDDEAQKRVRGVIQSMIREIEAM